MVQMVVVEPLEGLILAGRVQMEDVERILIEMDEKVKMEGMEGMVRMLQLFLKQQIRPF